MNILDKIVLEMEFIGNHINSIKDFYEAIYGIDSLWELMKGREVILNVKENYFPKNRIKLIDTKTNKIVASGNLEKGRVVSINYLCNLLVSIRVDFMGYRLINPENGRSRRIRKEYNIESFIQSFIEFFPPLNLSEIKKINIAISSHKQELENIRRREEVERLSKPLFEDLKYIFDQDFSSADFFYNLKCAGIIGEDEYQERKSIFVQKWIATNLKSDKPNTPDLEQARAIGAVEGHIQVVARAGSGKTATLVNRAIFLQKHCGISADEILLLAFNKEAAREIKKRLDKHLESNSSHPMTFHSLAYRIVNPRESLIYDIPDADEKQSRAIQEVIDRYLKDSEYYEEIRRIMMTRFNSDWERIISGGYLMSKDEMLRYRRSLPCLGWDGTNYKSFGEKTIANFLFEHNIGYKYEHNHTRGDRGDTSYCPDFTLTNKGIVIEYFGLQGNPDYDAMSDRKREYWQGKTDWQLLELNPDLLRAGNVQAFRDWLKSLLEGAGIACNDCLTEDEIWKKIKKRAIDKFTKAMGDFIKRSRKLTYTPDQLNDLIYQHKCETEAEERFIHLGKVFYESYLEAIKEQGEEDFDGLMQRAAEKIDSGQTVFESKSGSRDLKKLRYIFIDEYQDFSDLFYRLTIAIRKHNPEVEFFCVGDDWQAINGFAGSDLEFYKKFTELFEPSQQLHISTNYRSHESIVDIGNKLMQGKGEPARANKQEVGKVEIVDLSKFKPSTGESEKFRAGDEFTQSILRIVGKAIDQNKKVTLLSRTNRLSWELKSSNKLDSFLYLIRLKLPEDRRNMISASTIHKYKGAQNDIVILIDCVAKSYPLIHPNWIFSRIFGDSLEKVIEDERRLFYVALTRAVEHLFIITDSSKQSPFLTELLGRDSITEIDWSEYPLFSCTEVRVGNQDDKDNDGVLFVKDLLKAEHYEWNDRAKQWRRTYFTSDFSIPGFLDKYSWLETVDGVEIQFLDNHENVIEAYIVTDGKLKKAPAYYKNI
ncbi:UvrD-helicase domain-containing protein [Thalassoporum mexicanum]|uniref:UvrD-helicase domain-containing protein n=1 Tax=Thalassoporum mexicanum TaxID=3457544 RepID=UPI000687B955|nr:UvrD-helicase domain-containing protein [Pseudanabaena sp. PCC 7367]